MEANIDMLSSSKVLETLLRKSKKEYSDRVLDNILSQNNIEEIKKAKELAIFYGTASVVIEKITKRLVELGDMDAVATQLADSVTDFNNIPSELVNIAKEKNPIAIAFFNDNCEKSELVVTLGAEVGAEKCIEKYSLRLIKNGEYEKAKEINPNLINNSIWGYLLYNWNECALAPAIQDAIRLLRFQTELDAKATAKEINNLFIGKPHGINKEEIDAIIHYANTTGQYFKGGIALLAQNVSNAFLLLTKHYLNNANNLLTLCEIVLHVDGLAIDKDIFSFNKAMCLLSKGGFFNKNKAKGILNELVTLKHLSVLEKLHKKPYQPAIDFLDGKEINEEYLLNIKI